MFGDKFCLAHNFYLLLSTTLLTQDPDHGEKWLHKTLNNTLTRRFLALLEVVIFISWPLGYYRYLTCHNQPDIEIRLELES